MLGRDSDPRVGLLSAMTPAEWASVEDAYREGLRNPEGGLWDYEAMVGYFGGQASVRLRSDGVPESDHPGTTNPWVPFPTIIVFV